MIQTGDNANATCAKGQQLAGDLLPLVTGATLVRADEPLARRTTFRVGGPADVYVEPASEEDLAAVLGFCAHVGEKFFVLGRGSNLLVRDGGFRGVVICLGHPNFSRLEITGDRMYAGAGVRLKAVAVEARRAILQPCFCGMMPQHCRFPDLPVDAHEAGAYAAKTTSQVVLLELQAKRLECTQPSMDRGARGVPKRVGCVSAVTPAHRQACRPAGKSWPSIQQMDPRLQACDRSTYRPREALVEPLDVAAEIFLPRDDDLRGG